MYLRQVVFFVLCYLNFCYCYPERVLLQSNGCNNEATGFTCLPMDGPKKTVIFECPDKSKEYLFLTNEFNGPASIDNLIIRNCTSLTISFQCSTSPKENKDLKYLEVSNIENLKMIQSLRDPSVFPPTAVFENITKIDDIPTFTFAERYYMRNGSRTSCHLPTKDFASLRFLNVSIDTIQDKAFYLLNDFRNFSFVNVTVGQLSVSSLIINQGAEARFLIKNSTFGRLGFFSFQIQGGSVTFSQNSFKNITSTSIQTICDKFTFENNTVHSIGSRGLSIESDNILISSNDFLYFKTGALAETGTSNSTYSRKKAKYVFRRNKIIFLEEDSLLPDLNRYENIPTQVIFKDNVLSCNHHEIDWPISPNRNSTPRELFYHQVFAKESNNMCTYIHRVSTTRDTGVTAEDGKHLHNGGNSRLQSYLFSFLLMKVQIYIFLHHVL